MSFLQKPTTRSNANGQCLRAGKGNVPLRFLSRDVCLGDPRVFSMEPKTRGASVRPKIRVSSLSQHKPINFGLGRKPLPGKDLFSAPLRTTTKAPVAFSDRRVEAPTLIGPYDSINSFVSTKSVDANKEAIRKVCEANMNIDVTFDGKCNGKGQMVSNHEMCDFAISMLRFERSHSEHSGKLLVEFQRHNGSSFVFSEFVSFVVGNLKRDTDVVQFTRVQESSFLRSLPTPIDDLSLSDFDLSDDDFDVEEEEASCANDLVEMLSDGYAKCRRDAAALLARKSEEEKFKSTLISVAPQLLEQLSKAIKSCNDCQVVRSVSVVLSNLVQDESMCERARSVSSLITNLQSQYQKWSPQSYPARGVHPRIEPSKHVADHLRSTLRLLQCEA